MPGNYYTRHMTGMVVVGLIMYGFMTLSSRYLGQPSHYYIEGVGYATIMDILRGELTAWGFLLVLVVAKLLVTCLTLGSGASGGVFSPAMFLGATLGGCFGSALLHFFPDLPMTPAHFAYAGMAGMVGGSTGAVLTGTIMIFEMTRDYTTILSVILAAALACATRNWLSFSTIYTSKLLRRGEMAPQGLQARVSENKSRYFMTKDFVVLPQDQAGEPEVVRRELLHGQVAVVIGPGNRIIGLIDERSRPETSLPEAGIYVAVDPEMPLSAVLRAIDAAGARLALVVNQAEGGGQEVLGVITERVVSRQSHAIARLGD
jgi:CIC family chloride channel protein